MMTQNQSRTPEFLIQAIQSKLQLLAANGIALSRIAIMSNIDLIWLKHIQKRGGSIPLPQRRLQATLARLEALR